MKRQQQGYANVGIAVIVLALIISAVGWYVYKAQTTKDKDSAKSQSQSQTAKSEDTAQESKTAPEETKNIVKIPELGIQLTVTDALKDLRYAIRDGEYDEGAFIGADFSTAQLEALDAKCMSSNAPLGGIFRSEGQAPTTAPETPTAQPPADKQFATFNITYSRGNGGACSEKPAVTAELDKIGNVKAGILSIGQIE